jgi:uncharacterized protein YnzC (UPF0291/DUF896 family)
MDAPGRETIDNLEFIDEQGATVTPVDWRGERVLLVFMRWLG